MNNLDYLEDIAALHEPTLDVDEGVYWTPILEFSPVSFEAYYQENV